MQGPQGINRQTFRFPWILTTRFFDERSPTVWFSAALLALVLSALGLGLSNDLAGMQLFLSLLALAASVLTRYWPLKSGPPGLLTVWIIAVAASWLSPTAALSADSQRVIFSVVLLVVSFVYQGPRHFFPILAAALWFLSFTGFSRIGLGRDLSGLTLGALLGDILENILEKDSVVFLLGTTLLSGVIYSGRVAISRASEFQAALGRTTEAIEKVRTQVTTSAEAVHLARERLWGRTFSERTPGGPENGPEDRSDVGAGVSIDLSTVAFDQLITVLRKVFADFQLEGRASGRISGPIRFVFFAPAAGYDGRVLIAADLDSVARGVTAFLNLALESLPEVGNRKREGVIRLSIRSGVRTIEIAVEDNGRGLASPNPKVEADYQTIKELTTKWSGTLDRVARLGVGSRTALELRKLSPVARAPSVEVTPRSLYPESVGPHA